MDKKKICMIGSFAVGKTSLVERFVHNRFSDKYLTTIGVKVSQKIMPPVRQVTGVEPAQLLFLIWDIASIEKFNDMAKNYYRGSDGALAVCDLSRPETIEEMKTLAEDFRSINPEAQLVLLGNKSDIYTENDRTMRRLTRIASVYDSHLIQTSAKSGKNVENGFFELARKLSQ